MTTDELRKRLAARAHKQICSRADDHSEPSALIKCWSNADGAMDEFVDWLRARAAISNARRLQGEPQ